jgi:hypothetical protein
MTERTATSRQGGSTVGKPSASARYTRFTDSQLDAASTWLRDRGPAPWSKRFKIEGGNVVGDLRGMSPVIREMVRDYFDAIQLMTPGQIRQLTTAGPGEGIALVEDVLKGAGR